MNGLNGENGLHVLVELTQEQGHAFHPQMEDSIVQILNNTTTDTILQILAMKVFVQVNYIPEYL